MSERRTVDTLVAQKILRKALHKVAYRHLAAERHPDKPGGSEAMMADLNAARDAALKERS